MVPTWDDHLALAARVAVLEGVAPPPPPPPDDNATYPTDAAIITEHDTVPNFAKDTTILSVRSGRWSDASTWDKNRIPKDDDVAGIKTTHAVTYDVNSPAVLMAVGVAGSLIAAQGKSLGLIVQHFILYDTGYLEIGTEAAPIHPDDTVRFTTPDVPLEAIGDPAQYGNGWHFFGKVRIHGAVTTPYVRATGDVAAKSAAVALTVAPTNWRKGDRLMIPDSRPFIDPNSMKPFLDEVVTLESDVGAANAAVSPFANDHPAWHADDGSVDRGWTPHVANLTRNVIFKSENPDPEHARGHVMFHGRCDVDIRYYRFDSLGRTKWTASVAPGTNQKGRYAQHWHHPVGPKQTPASGYQFVTIGGVIEDRAIEPRKWGIVIHDGHFGLIRQNICYRNGGANLYTEQGNESFNVIEGNLFARSVGTNGRGDAHYNGGNPGLEGCGAWLSGMNNYVRNNIAVNAEAFLYGIYNGDFPETGGGHAGALIPDFQGADPDKNGHAPEGGNIPILEFKNNEGYGCDIGLAPWFTGAVYTSVEKIAPSVIEGYKSWNVKRGTFCYPTNNLKFLKCSFRVSFDQLRYPIGSYGILPVDYLQRGQVVEGCEFLGTRIGVGVPSKVGDLRDPSSASEGLYLIKDCTFQCLADVLEYTFTAVTGGSDVQAPRKVIIDNPTFLPIKSDTGEATRVHYSWSWFADNDSYPNLSWVQLDQTFLLNYGGRDYQIWADQQAGDFITPQSFGPNVGSPDAGKTNAQNFADHGVCVRGEIMPTTGIVRMPGFVGWMQQLT
jgi:hypothetical protein